jgi:hypothetical protein
MIKTHQQTQNTFHLKGARTRESRLFHDLREFTISSVQKDLTGSRARAYLEK